jgi:putative tryptophan/tyrosine transport system substrate-binding protein
MRRRDLLSLIGGAAVTAPLAVRAQQKAMPVVGYLSGRSLGDSPSLVAAFRHGLVDEGYTEGRNLAIEYRFAEGDYDRFPVLAADLVDRNVAVVAAVGGMTAALAAKRASATIPIVFFVGGDPVAAGLVASLARPDGNLTGVGIQLTELTPKRLELLSELVPHAGLIALLVNPGNANANRLSGEMQATARAKRIKLPILKAGTAAEIDAVFAGLAGGHVEALIVGDDPFFASRSEQIVGLASHYAVPAIFPDRKFVTSGGLISYGPNFADALRIVGGYVGRVLKGVKAVDLPVQQPTAFDLVINLKTAKALGLTVPQSILAGADEVIE